MKLVRFVEEMGSGSLGKPKPADSRDRSGMRLSHIMLARMFDDTTGLMT